MKDNMDLAEAKVESFVPVIEPVNSNEVEWLSHGNEKSNNFIDESETCRGNGVECLAGFVCCSGKCEEPAGAIRVYKCAPQLKEAFHTQNVEENFLDESCRGNGVSCFVHSNCCSNRCVEHVQTRVCVP